VLFALLHPISWRKKTVHIIGFHCEYRLHFMQQLIGSRKIDFFLESLICLNDETSSVLRPTHKLSFRL
jgi:hypothetical protein